MADALIKKDEVGGLSCSRPPTFMARCRMCQQIAYAQDQVRHLLSEGLLTPETYFWREGMPKWRPLSEAFRTSATSCVVPPRHSDNPLSSPQESPEALSSSGLASRLPLYSEPVDPSTEEESAPSRRRRSNREFRLRRNPIPLTIVLQALTLCSTVATAFFCYHCYHKVYGSHTRFCFVSNDTSSSVLAATLDSPLLAYRILKNLFATYFWSLLALHLVNGILFLFGYTRPI